MSSPAETLQELEDSIDELEESIQSLRDRSMFVMGLSVGLGLAAIVFGLIAIF